MKKVKRTVEEQLKDYVKLVGQVLSELKTDLGSKRKDVADYLESVTKGTNLGAITVDVKDDGKAARTHEVDSAAKKSSIKQTIQFKNGDSQEISTELDGPEIDDTPIKKVTADKLRNLSCGKIEVERYEDLSDKDKSSAVTEVLVRAMGTPTNRVEFYLPENKVLYQTGKESGFIYEVDNAGKVVRREISSDFDKFREDEIFKPRRDSAEKAKKEKSDKIKGVLLGLGALGIAGAITASAIIGYISGKNSNNNQLPNNTKNPPVSDTTTPDTTGPSFDTTTPDTTGPADSSQYVMEAVDDVLPDELPFDMDAYISHEKMVVGTAQGRDAEGNKMVRVDFANKDGIDTEADYSLYLFERGYYHLVDGSNNLVVYASPEDALDSLIVSEDGERVSATINKVPLTILFNAETGTQIFYDRILDEFDTDSDSTNIMYITPDEIETYISETVMGD